MTVPSSSAVCATKAPSTGGFDLVIVRSVPPVFDTVKLNDLLDPAPTAPKSIDAGLITRTGGSPAVPVPGLVSMPPVLSIENELLKLPFAEGANCTGIVTDPPEASDCPTAGRPPRENGALGGVNAFHTSGCAPMFDKTRFIVAVVPRAMPPKLTMVVAVDSTGEFDWPVPLRDTEARPAEVLTFSAAA